MRITFEIPSLCTGEQQLVVLHHVIVQLRALLREEDHEVVFPSRIASAPLLLACMSALLTLKQKEGYRIHYNHQEFAHFVTTVDVRQPSDAMEKLIQRTPAHRVDLKNLLGYLAGELLDNVEEHARASFATLVLLPGEQFSFVVADTGISIPAAYKEAGIEVNNEQDALMKAVSGVSTKTVEERGKGLPSISRLAVEAMSGVIHVFSGSTLLTRSREGVQYHRAPCYWQGTVIALQGILPAEPFNLYHYLT